MIKRTFKTIKQNPIIVAILFIPFVYSTINTIFFADVRVAYNPMILMEQTSNPMVWVSILFNFLYMVGYSIFLYPAISRYIYLAASEMPREKWYQKCFKGFWWRGFVINIFVGIVTMVFLMPIAVGAALVYFNTYSVFWVILLGVVAALLLFVVTSFNFIAISAVFAEDDFSAGFSNMFKAWKKSFRKIIPLALIGFLPFIAIYVSMFGYGVEQLDNVMSIGLSFYMILVGIFTAVYSMHCYVDYKNKQIAETQAEGSCENR